MKRPPYRFAFVAIFIGAVIAVLEGLSNLECASRPDIFMTIAGSFGAGAAFAAFMVPRRRALAAQESKH